MKFDRHMRLLLCVLVAPLILLALYVLTYPLVLKTWLMSCTSTPPSGYLLDSVTHIVSSQEEADSYHRSYQLKWTEYAEPISYAQHQSKLFKLLFDQYDKLYGEETLSYYDRTMFRMHDDQLQPVLIGYEDLVPNQRRSLEEFNARQVEHY